MPQEDDASSDTTYPNSTDNDSIYSFDSDREFVQFSTPVLDTALTRNSPMLSPVVVEEQTSNTEPAPDQVCESVLADIASCLSTHEAELAILESHLNSLHDPVLNVPGSGLPLASEDTTKDSNSLRETSNQNCAQSVISTGSLHLDAMFKAVSPQIPESRPAITAVCDTEGLSVDHVDSYLSESHVSQVSLTCDVDQSGCEPKSCVSSESKLSPEPTLPHAPNIDESAFSGFTGESNMYSKKLQLLRRRLSFSPVRKSLTDVQNVIDEYRRRSRSRIRSIHRGNLENSNTDLSSVTQPKVSSNYHTRSKGPVPCNSHL